MVSWFKPKPKVPILESQVATPIARDFQRELPAQLLKQLEFKVLRKLDGFLFGDYTGLFYGPSLDLAEVREYQPGDEVRRIDWNVTARTGKLHVRQYREEREMTGWVVVDLSPSMKFGTRRVLKRDEALEFAALASSIVTRKGNKMGAIGVSEKGMTVVPPGSGRKQTLSILQSLINLDTRVSGQTGSLEQALEYLGARRRRALVWVVSDFLSAHSELSWSLPLRRLAYKHDVIAIHISDPAERTLPKVGNVRLRDPETSQEIWIDTGDARVRKTHAKLVYERHEAMHKAFKQAHVDALELSTDRDIVGPILKFTMKRRGRR
jgi:uncharacterized protein (DUF58 family)